MRFATPEASRKLAGGEASNASENHRTIAKKASTPAGGAGMDRDEDRDTNSVCSSPPCRGAFFSYTRSGGSRSLRSLHHRLISVVPPGRGIVSTRRRSEVHDSL